MESTCRICLQPLIPYAMGEKNGYALTACQACGSVTTSPWPTPADLDKFFGDVQPDIVHLPNPEAEIMTRSKLLAGLAKGLSGKRFLDVSCRQGYAVMAAKALGLQAKGIDPHEFFITFAKDKYDAALFEHISVADYAARGEQADIVYAVESFCEQTDPEAYMAALARLLAPGGVLYLQEPDGNHFNLPKDLSRWAFVEPPLNFSYISKKGMLLLLARHGLKLKKALSSMMPYSEHSLFKPFMHLIVTKP